MIRLVTSYRKDLLTETHLHLAQQLETEGSFKAAEKHYVEASDWGSAVNMYRANDLWDDAVRVAKLHGDLPCISPASPLHLPHISRRRCAWPSCTAE